MQTGNESNHASGSFDRRLAAWLVPLLLAVVFFGAIRYRLRGMPLERDEGEYAYAGQLMLEGIPPYTLAYNMKLPGIYAAYAVVMAVFGETAGGIHLGLLLVNAATTLLLFYLAARLFGRLTALVAAISYALLSTSASVMGFEAHATNFVVLPALLGILILLRALETGRGWMLLVSGLCMGVAFLMKQHGLFFAVFGVVYLWVECSQKGWRFLAQRTAIFGCGTILPYVVTCWLMFRARVFSRFWFWTVDYAGEYSKIGLRRAIRTFLENSRHVVARPFLIWCLAAVGLAAIFWNPTARRHSGFLILFLACSFLALCPGAYFRPHYYVLLLPAIAMLAGLGVRSLADLRIGRPKAMTLIVFLFCLGISVLLQAQVYFFLSPDDVVRRIYAYNAFVPAVAVADSVRAHSPEEATIAVLGSEPEIYFYAHRHSATGYLYMYSLIVHHKYTARMRNEMMQELERNRPLYVIYVDVWDDWGGPEGGPELEEFLPRLREFMNRYYERAGGLDDPPLYVWNSDEHSYQPRLPRRIYVLRRKD